MTGDRRLALAVRIAAFGAMFNHERKAAGTPAAGSVAGLNAIFLIATLVVLAAAVATWPLLGRLGSST